MIDIGTLCYSAQMVSGAGEPVGAALKARVDQLVAIINAGPPLSSDRRSEVELQLRKLLATRLQLASDRARLPGIAEERIERPIFVVGFARTGTTLIHSLLAEDPGARAPQWWQTHQPSPPPGEAPVVNARIEFAAQDLDSMLRMAPGLLRLHPYWDKRGYALIEDEEIFTLDFQNAYPSVLYRVPALPVLLNASNIGQAYAFHREFLQHLQWNLPKKHWVLKGTYHQFVLDQLFDAYPDALCVWPHRDPVEVWPSMLAITAVLYGAITEWTVDFKTLGAAMLESTRAGLDAALANPLIDDPRIVHLNFRELARDPVSAIAGVYARRERTFSGEFETRMRAWLKDPANRSDRYGRYEYTLEPFGLTPDGLRHAFRAYRERFDLD